MHRVPGLLRGRDWGLCFRNITFALFVVYDCTEDRKTKKSEELSTGTLEFIKIEEETSSHKRRDLREEKLGRKRSAEMINYREYHHLNEAAVEQFLTILHLDDVLIDVPSNLGGIHRRRTESVTPQVGEDEGRTHFLDVRRRVAHYCRPEASGGRDGDGGGSGGIWGRSSPSRRRSSRSSSRPREKSKGRRTSQTGGRKPTASSATRIPFAPRGTNGSRRQRLVKGQKGLSNGAHELLLPLLTHISQP